MFKKTVLIIGGGFAGLMFLGSLGHEAAPAKESKPQEYWEGHAIWKDDRPPVCNYKTYPTGKSVAICDLTKGGVPEPLPGKCSKLNWKGIAIGLICETN